MSSVPTPEIRRYTYKPKPETQNPGTLEPHTLGTAPAQQQSTTGPYQGLYMCMYGQNQVYIYVYIYICTESTTFLFTRQKSLENALLAVKYGARTA